MKVLHYVDENRLSWGVPWLQLLEAQRQRGDEHLVVCRPGGTLGRLLRERGFPIYFYKPAFPSFPRLCPGFMKILRELKPDLIHTRLSSAAAIGGYWGKRAGIPVLSTVDKFAKLRYYRNAERLLACSSSLRNYLLQAGHPANRVSVVQNAVELDHYRRDRGKRAEMREHMGVSEEGIKVILGAGRLVYGKGFDVLVRAFSIVKPPCAVLRIIGSGPEQGRLEELIRELGLSSRAELLPFVSDLRPYLWASDLFVLPSRSLEGFGLVLLEAMASGVPVIATAVGGPVDLVEEGRSGWLVEPGNVEHLAEKISEILDNPSAMARVGEGAYERAKRFDVKECAETIQAEYKEVLVEWRGKNDPPLGVLRDPE